MISRKRSAVVSFVMTTLGLTMPSGVNSQNVEEAAAEEVIEEILVLGSRIKRRDALAASPLFTFSREDLNTSTQATLEESLNRLPQLVPDFGRSSNNPGDGTARLNLRGMGSERTLVLLNSRRIAPSGVGSSVDINNIPKFLVDRVEIITGGASAVYGSDALAGVVNFVLKDDFEGIQIGTQLGATDRGDARFKDVNIALGKNFAAGWGNISAYGGFYDRDSLFAGERSLTSVARREDGAGNLLEVGSFTVPEGVLFNPVPGLGFPIFEPNGNPRSFVNPDDQYNFAPDTYLQTPLERLTAGLFGRFEFDSGIELYLETSHTKNESARELAAVPLTSNVSVNISNPVLSDAAAQLFADNFADPGAADPTIARFTLSRRLSELGSRMLEVERDYSRTLVGLRGDIGSGDWRFDSWVSFTVSDEVELLRNDGSQTRFLQGLLVDPLTGQCFDPSNGCVPVDPFGAGRLSPEAAEFVRYGPLRNDTERKQALAGIFFSGSLGESWAGPVDAVFGLEWRRDSVDFKADDVLFTGDTLGYRGDSPISGVEKVTEVYAETVVPLRRGASGDERVSLELGSRYSKYDNAGGVWAHKIGASWRLSDALRLRAMWQQSVRAPNNQELFQRQFIEVSNFVGALTFVDNCSASQDPVGNGLADVCIAQGLRADQLGTFEAIPFFPVNFIRGGNDQLEPEQADTLTAGFVYSPDHSLAWSLSVDYYEIDVSRSIGEIDAKSICFDAANTSRVFCDRIRRITDPANSAAGNVFEVEELFNNRGRISTKGVDVQLRLQASLPQMLAIVGDEASATANFSWTHLSELRFQGNQVSSVDSCVGYFSTPCTGFNSSSTGAQDRLSASVLYESGALSASLLARWISGTESYQIAEALQQGTTVPVLAVPDIGSQLTVDLAVGFAISESLDVRLGVSNLLDKAAPLIPDQANNTDAQLYDVYGRAFSLSFSFGFAD